MKQTVKRSRVIEIVQGYESLKQLQGVKLAYAVSKNMTALQREKKSIEAAQPKGENLEKYREEYSVILEAEAKRDEQGNFIPTGGGNIAIADFKSFKAKVKALDKKFEKELEKQKTKTEEFEKFLDEDCEIEFFQFEESLLPESITVEQIGLLSEMISPL